MSKRKGRKNKGDGSGSQGASGSTGSSTSSVPDVGAKRPLSEGSPEPGNSTDNKRQRDGSMNSVADDNVFGANVGNNPDNEGNNSESIESSIPGLDKPKLTEDLMKELERFLQNDDLRIEGGGEEMNGATLVMNTLLRKILPFFLAFIIDKFSQINKSNEPKVTPPVVQGTEGG